MKPPSSEVTVYPVGIKVKVAPDDQLTLWPDHLPVPEIGVFEWVAQGDGNYKPMIRLHPKLVRMGESTIKELGLGVSYNSLRRLMTGGFVRYVQVTPGNYAVDLQSFYQHIAKVKADPDFWTGKNLKKYMEAI